MAELTHFYNDDNVFFQVTGTAWLTDSSSQILGSSLAANTKYLIVARCVMSGNNASSVVGCRIQTADDATIETKSAFHYEVEQTSIDAGASYLFVHSYITDSSPADIRFQANEDGSGTCRIDQLSLFLLDLDAVSAPNLLGTHHFDASDAGPTDSSANWTNDANAFDGSVSTFATSSASGTGTLSGEGTTAPTTGATIGEVWVRLFFKGASDIPSFDWNVYEDSVGGTVLYAGVETTTAAPAWIERKLTAPAGGWTWQKINDLAIDFEDNTNQSTADVYKAEVRVYDVNGRGYFEDIQAASGDLLSKTADTTVMASLAGSDLGTDEHLILGYGRCDVANTGRYFDISLHSAYDTSTAAVRQRHRAEGEDTNEQRIVGFALRHQASSGTPNVTIFGATENAGGGQNEDGGGYLIALPTALFADFVDDYEAGSAVIDSTEATIATSGSYTPTVTGNHLIFGRSNGSATPTALGGMWVDSTTTEIRTGDATPTHNQIWDNTKDEEFMATFQRYSITTAETFNLQSDGAGTDFDVEHRWLIVVNLNEPATGATVYPPFPQQQRRAVRM